VRRVVLHTGTSVGPVDLFGGPFAVGYRIGGFNSHRPGAGVIKRFRAGYLPFRPACPCSTALPSVVAVAARNAVKAFATLVPVMFKVGVDSA